MTLKIRTEHGKAKIHRSHMPGGRRFPFKGHQEYAETLERQAKRLEAELHTEQRHRPERRVTCSDCLQVQIQITGILRRYYCSAKQTWIPERKYYRKHKCGRFKGGEAI